MTPKKRNKGFSYIELLITIGIVVTILTTVTTGQNKYSESLNITNSAENIASLIRQAQAFEGREVTVSSAEFNKDYVVSIFNDNLGNPHVILSVGHYFRQPPFQYCDPVDDTFCIDKVELTPGYTLSNFCLIKLDNTVDCSGLYAGYLSIKGFEVYYRRPSLEARFYLRGDNWVSSLSQYNSINGVQFNISGPNGYSRLVKVNISGYVEVI